MRTVAPCAPRTFLEQLIRERESTYEEICDQLNELARKLHLDATMSVRHLQRLAYGERPTSRPAPATRRLVRAFFGHSMDDLLGRPKTEDELGSRTEMSVDIHDLPSELGQAGDTLAERLRTGRCVDDTLIHLLAEETNHLRLIDRRLGGSFLAVKLDAQLATMRSLFETTMDEAMRQALARQLSDVEALAAWVVLDRGDVDAAWRHHEAARLMAKEGGSPSLLAHALVQQAFVAIEVNQPDAALALVRKARATAGTAVPPLLASWLWAGEGEVLAVAGDDGGCRRAFNNATRLLPNDPVDPDLPYIQLDPTHLARWHGSALARLGDQAAIEHLYAALDAPDNSLRALAGLHVDLTYAHVAAGADGRARAHIEQGKAFAERAGSRRQLRRIQRLMAQHDRLRGD